MLSDMSYLISFSWEMIIFIMYVDFSSYLQFLNGDMSVQVHFWQQNGNLSSVLVSRPPASPTLWPSLYFHVDALLCSVQL